MWLTGRIAELFGGVDVEEAHIVSRTSAPLPQATPPWPQIEDAFKSGQELSDSELASTLRQAAENGMPAPIHVLKLVAKHVEMLEMSSFDLSGASQVLRGQS